jgi:hypothetical protein
MIPAGTRDSLNIREEANDLAAEITLHIGQRRSLLSRKLLTTAKELLLRLATKWDRQNSEIFFLKQVEKSLRQDVKDVEKDGVRLAKRIDIAIDEMRYKRGDGYRSYHGRQEEPFAIIVSPYQRQQLRWSVGLGREQREDLPPLKTYKNIPIYVAAGVYGPLVLTEDAFNAVSRQAPELRLEIAR